MANKEFKIQSDTISLNGVPLSSSADGKVVLPGVTRATGYVVKEVKDIDAEIDLPGFNPETVMVIDHAQWNLYSGLTLSPQYVAAQYTVNLDEGEIDEIDVSVPGVFADSDRTLAIGGLMWATDVVGATDNFNINDWVQIPFLPKFQASTIESDLGGGGNANTGDITFENNMIIGAGEDSGDGNGYDTIRLVPDASLGENGQYIVIDPTAPNHIHIRAGGEQDNSNAILFLGGEKNNVSIEDGNGVTISNEQTFDSFNYYSAGLDFTDFTWFEENGNYFVQFTTVTAPMVGDFWNFTNGSPNALRVYDSQGQYTLTYGGSGSNTVANVYKLQVVETPIVDFVATALEFQIFTTNYNEMYLRNNDFRVDVKDDVRIIGSDVFRLTNNSTDEPIEIVTNDDNTSNTWSFNANGTLRLPGGAEINSTNNNIELTVGTSIYTFSYDQMVGSSLQIPGSIQGSTQTSFLSSNGLGISIDGFNSPNTVDIGNIPSSTVLRLKDGDGVGNIIVQALGTSLKLQTGNGTTWELNSNGSLTFPDLTVQTTAWAGGRVVAVPTTSTGTTGDKQGDVAFDSTYMYYCFADFPTTYEATLYGGYSGNAFPSIAKGDYPQPLTGWTFVWNTVTYTLIENATDPNAGQWSLRVDQTIDTQGGGTITLTPPGGSIWKRVAWSNDTW